MITAAIVPNTSSTFSARPKTKPSKIACSDRAPTVINGLSKILTGKLHEKLENSKKTESSGKTGKFRENRKASEKPENFVKTGKSWEKRKVLPGNNIKELLLIQ